MQASGGRTASDGTYMYVYDETPPGNLEIYDSSSFTNVYNQTVGPISVLPVATSIGGGLMALDAVEHKMVVADFSRLVHIDVTNPAAPQILATGVMPVASNRWGR